MFLSRCRYDMSVCILHVLLCIYIHMIRSEDLTSPRPMIEIMLMANLVYWY